MIDLPPIDWPLVSRMFMTVLLVMDPLGTIPVFLALTRDRTAAQRAKAATQATVGAAAIIATFALAGEAVLAALGISLASLQIAGGLLLVVIALELLQVVDDGSDSTRSENVSLGPLATPLLAGPGAIATTMLGVREAGGGWGTVQVAAALGAVFVVVFAALRGASFVAHRVPGAAIGLLSKVMGLLVAAIAVQLVADGVTSMIAGS